MPATYTRLCSLEVYERDLLAHLHFPYSRVLYEAANLSTHEFVECIERQGLTNYEQHLATLRNQIEQAKTAAKAASLKQTRLAGEIATLERLLAEYAQNPPTYRDHSGRLVIAFHESDRTATALIAAKKSIAWSKSDQRYAEEKAKNLALIEERLAVGLLAYLRRETTKAEPAATVPAPVVNVTVQTPDELRITAMPSRRTTSTVERDSQGHIVSTVQIEEDA